IEEGIVAGGGSVLVQAASVLDDNLGLSGDEAVGIRVVRRGIDAPLEWIARNGGASGEVVVSKVRESGKGYNVVADDYGDLLAQGVLDPVKVTRSALANAASITGMLLTTETLVVDKPEDTEDDESSASPALRVSARPIGAGTVVFTPAHPPSRRLFPPIRRLFPPIRHSLPRQCHRAGRTKTHETRIASQPVMTYSRYV